MAKKKAAKKRSVKRRKLELRSIRKEINSRLNLLDKATPSAKNKGRAKRLRSALREIKAMCTDLVLNSDFTA